MKVRCPECRRDVAARGVVTRATLAPHNLMDRIGWESVVSSNRCPGSGAAVLPILLTLAEREHDAAKRADDRAREALAKAQKQVDEARAALDRTASEIDRLRGLQKGGAK